MFKSLRLGLGAFILNTFLGFYGMHFIICEASANLVTNYSEEKPFSLYLTCVIIAYLFFKGITLIERINKGHVCIWKPFECLDKILDKIMYFRVPLTLSLIEKAHGVCMCEIWQASYHIYICVLIFNVYKLSFLKGCHERVLNNENKTKNI